MRILKTKLKYSKEGKYLAERLFLHDTIIQCKKHDVLRQEQPVAILMGGGSASGKSWLRGLIHQEQQVLGNEFIIIDADEIKELLPEYTELTQKCPERTAMILHDESSDIAYKLLEVSAEGDHHFIYDGTMKNFTKYDGIIYMLKEKNYTIRIVIADVDIDEAIRRNEQRFKDTGRLVPRPELVNSHVNVAKVFLQLKDKVDEYVLFDTFNDYTVFASKTLEEGEQIENELRFNLFLEKSNLKSPDVIVGKKSS